MTFTLTSPIPGTKIPIFGVLSLLGGFLLQFTMGSFYSFGNMMTYMTSYMRAHGSPNVTYEDFVVVQSTWGMTQGCVMPVSGFLIAMIGEKAAMTSGAFIFSLGCALTYVTINKELWMVAATYGFVSAFGQNIALIPTLTTAMKWFPNRKGTAMGVVVGGFGGGAMVFNQIQTAIVNFENYNIATSGANEGYFTEETVLNRVPGLLLILAAIYLVMGLLGAIMICQPPEDWVRRNSIEEFAEIELMENEKQEKALMKDDSSQSDDYLHWKDALKSKEFYLLWVTRLSVVLITQVVAALYKAFGQTFIYDDHFLAIVGAICSFFNCAGRLMYGLIMDKTSYKFAMSVESILLTLLVATFYLTSLVGVSEREVCECVTTTISSILNTTAIATDSACVCDPPETAAITKIVYAIWVWAIFLTFPGTYAMQPAITTQTFGHKYGGTIYAFLFSSDIINNLMVAALSKEIKQRFGYLGLFTIISAWGILSLLATLMYPKNPSPSKKKQEKSVNDVNSSSNH